jgi:hypothetical protein
MFVIQFSRLVQIKGEHAKRIKDNNGPKSNAPTVYQTYLDKYIVNKPKFCPGANKYIEHAGTITRHLCRPFPVSMDKNYTE